MHRSQVSQKLALSKNSYALSRVGIMPYEIYKDFTTELCVGKIPFEPTTLKKVN